MRPPKPMVEPTKASAVEGMTPKPSRRNDAAGLLDLLVEQVVDYAIFVLDADGSIASWNPGAQRIKGYSPDEIIGKPYAHLLHRGGPARGQAEQILS